MLFLLFFSGVLSLGAPVLSGLGSASRGAFQDQTLWGG